MGWTGTHTTLTTSEFLRQRWERDGNYKVVAHSGKYWVMEKTCGDKQGQRFAVVVLSRKTRDGDITWKEITEDMGPYDCDCPNRLLDLLSPTDNEYAQEWRAKCRERNSHKTTGKLVPGDRVVFSGNLPRFSNGLEVVTGEFLRGYKFRLTTADDRTFVGSMRKDWKTYYTWEKI